MTSKLRTLAVLSLAIAAFAVGAGRAVLAIDFKDISGKWCSPVSSYVFEDKTLAVLLNADKSRREYAVDKYEYGADGIVTVTWQRDGSKVFTRFALKDNGTTLVQQQDRGALRDFKRCL